MGTDIVKMARARAAKNPAMGLSGGADLAPLEAKVADGEGKSLDEHRQLLQVRDEFKSRMDKVVSDGLNRMLGEAIVVTSKSKLQAGGQITARLATISQMGVEISGAGPSSNYAPGCIVSHKGDAFTYVVGLVKVSNEPVPEMTPTFTVKLPLPGKTAGKTLTAKVFDVSGDILFDGPIPQVLRGGGLGRPRVG